MAQTVLRKPLLTEKATLMGEKSIYTFEVSPESNKIQISAAVESQFDVKVADVNTMWMPLRRKSQFTRKGVLRGTKSRRKKAIVTLKPGFRIDLFTPMAGKEKAEM